VTDNPQVGHLDEVVFLRPKVETREDPETKEKLDVTWMPIMAKAETLDEAGQPKPVRFLMRNAVIMPSRAEERQLLEGKPCLACKFFDYSKSAREHMQRNGWDVQIERRLVQVGSSSQIRGREYGICGAHSGRVCSPMAPPCDQWRPRRKGWRHYVTSAAAAAKRHLNVVR